MTKKQLLDYTKSSNFSNKNKKNPLDRKLKKENIDSRYNTIG